MTQSRAFRSGAWIALFLAVAAFSGNAWAIVNVPSKSFDAGSVEIGQEIVHEFSFINEGSETVNITEVRPSCGCTVPEYPTDGIAPGETATVKLVLDTSELHPGKQSKSVTIVTDDPDTRRVILQVKMHLFTALEFLPKALVYMRTEMGQAATQKVLARPHRDGMKILGATADNEHIVVKFEQAEVKAAVSSKTPKGFAAAMIPKAGDYWVTIELKPSAPVGIHRGEVRIKTSDPDHPEGSIKVNAVVSEKRAAN